jgi:hypothetical protein
MSNPFVSPGVLVTLALGILIAIAYVRAMWAALQKAVRIRDEPEERTADTYQYSLLGAVASVLISSLAITVYGFGPAFLYLGPVLALASPIAVTYCLRRELSE